MKKIYALIHFLEDSDPTMSENTAIEIVHHATGTRVHVTLKELKQALDA